MDCYLSISVSKYHSVIEKFFGHPSTNYDHIYLIHSSLGLDFEEAVYGPK